MELLTAHHLEVAVAGKHVCQDLDLQFRHGECWAILGPNGCGKTTLLHTLAGIRPPQSGEVVLKGKPLNAWSPRERAQLSGTLLQHYDDPFPSTVLETALIGRHPHLQRWKWEDQQDIAQARSALEMMDLAGFEHRSIATLSGGERRRLAIATLLTQNPKIMLLDEPTNHLDIFHQIHTLHLLTRLAAQEARALIMVLHDVTSTIRYCDHALLLFGKGETVAGAISDVINEENLERLYGYPIRRLPGPDGDVWTPAFINQG